MRYTITTAFALASVVGLLSFGAAAKVVNCNSPNASIQNTVDGANGPTTIFIEGNCVEDVTLTTDDITLSGNRMGAACNKADPSMSAGATIDGTITVDGVRAKIEFLEITGSGEGVRIENRADARLTCNEISNNQESGVDVLRSSNAVLRDNTVSENGQRRIDNPSIFFDCGLYVSHASTVRSEGNTYADNQYCAISVGLQASFRNGAFLEREFGGGPANPDETDVFIEKGCNPGTGEGCFTTDGEPVALEAFNNGVIDLRNAEVNGESGIAAQSSFRVDGEGLIQGNVTNQLGSMVRIRDRSVSIGDRTVSFTGQLRCFDTSQTFFSSVQCFQICSGSADPSLGNCRNTQCSDGIDNEPDGDTDFPADLQCADLNDDDESS